MAEIDIRRVFYNNAKLLMSTCIIHYRMDIKEFHTGRDRKVGVATYTCVHYTYCTGERQEKVEGEKQQHTS